MTLLLGLNVKYGITVGLMRLVLTMKYDNDGGLTRFGSDFKICIAEGLLCPDFEIWHHCRAYKFGPDFKIWHRCMIY